MPTVSPRTDAVTEGCVGRGSPWSYIRAVDLCRELESDLAAALAERDALAARVAEHDEYARLLDIRSYDTEAETAMDECINSPDWLAKLSKHPALIVRRLAARVAELENDAGRWRFVRSKVSRILNERTLKMDGLRVEVYYDEPQPFVILPTDNGALFDEAIDAALSREEES